MSGILLGSYFHLPASFFLAAIMGGILALAVCLVTGRSRAALLLALVVFSLFGCLYIGRVLHPMLPTHHILHFAGEGRLNVAGVLYRPPEPLPGKTRLYVRTENVRLDEGSFPVCGDLLLTVKSARVALRYGDRVRFISRVYLPRPATNPGAFDYRRFLALQEIRVTGFVNEESEIVRLEEGQGRAFLHLVENGRERIRNFFDAQAPARSRGVVKALVLGERGDIAPEVNEKFIVAGVNHILSISGLHVALVAAFFFGATRLLLKIFPPLLLRLDLQKTSAAVAVVPVIYYTFVAGLGVAAVRSMIMTLCFLLALLLDREKDLYDALFLAAFLILIATPAALFDISFQLSFSSVAAILYLLPRAREFLSPLEQWASGQAGWKREILLYAGGSLLTSAAAILGTGPLAVYYFNRLSLVGLISNLVLVPLMGLGNTLLSLLGAFFVFLSQPVAELLTALNVRILDLSLWLVDFFSRLPLASRRMATPTLAEMLLLYGILFFAANLKRWKRAWHGLVALSAVFIFFQAYDFLAIRYGQELKVTFLDVGQGDATVIRFPGGGVMVVDGGGSPDGSFDPGERIVGPYLWKEKRKRVDFLINSHEHPDHLQGLLFLLENFAVGKVWHNGEKEEASPLLESFAAAAGERLRAMGRGEIPLEIGGVKVEFLHPPLEEGQRERFSGNSASLVLRLSYGEVSFLFCGDIESPAEEDLLDRGLVLQSTVIKVPHHGSKTSSTPRFLEAVQPRYAVFTVRPGTRQRLPHPEVLARYESLGTQIFRTDRDGAITFVTYGKDVRVRTYLGG